LGCAVYDGRPIGLGWSRGSWSLGPRREGLEMTGLLPRPGFGLAWAPRPFLFFFLFHVLLKNMNLPQLKRLKDGHFFCPTFVWFVRLPPTCDPPPPTRAQQSKNGKPTQSPQEIGLPFLFFSSSIKNRWLQCMCLASTPWQLSLPWFWGNPCLLQEECATP
jgi:hypothetical protein